MERRRKFCEEHGIQKLYTSTTDNPFSGRIICGKCGRAYGRKVWNSTDEELRRIVWRCNDKYTEKGKVGMITGMLMMKCFIRHLLKLIMPWLKIWNISWLMGGAA